MALNLQENLLAMASFPRPGNEAFCSTKVELPAACRCSELPHGLAVGRNPAEKRVSTRMVAIGRLQKPQCVYTIYCC